MVFNLFQKTLFLDLPRVRIDYLMHMVDIFTTFTEKAAIIIEIKPTAMVRSTW